ncbi:MAG: hypothetical protein QM581_14650, partial [Pseudomonas sp.]
MPFFLILFALAMNGIAKAFGLGRGRACLWEGLQSAPQENRRAMMFDAPPREAMFRSRAVLWEGLQSRRFPRQARRD